MGMSMLTRCLLLIYSVCSSQAKAKTPDGDRWNASRTIDGQQQVYRFGRWNPTFNTHSNDGLHMVGFFTEGALASSLMTRMAGGTYVVPILGTMGGFLGSDIYEGAKGMSVFFAWQKEHYLDSEIKIINQHNFALTACLKGGVSE